MYRRIDLLSAAMGPEQDVLLRHMQERWAPKGAFIEPHGPKGSFCFVVLDGFVKAHDPRLGEWLVPPGGAFGVDALLLETPPARRYEAVTRCTLLSLSHEEMRALLSTGSALSQSLQLELAYLAGQHAQLELSRIAERC
jgi:CRP-like cAMP-binding protein